MKPLFVFLCVGLLFFTADRLGALKGLRPNLEQAAVPFLQSAALARRTTQAPFEWISFRRDLERDVQVLEKDRARLLSENERLQTLIEQSNELQQAKRTDARFVPTTLILASRSVLPVGSNQGIADGAAVTSEGVLVGVVTAVRPQMSEVSLIEFYQGKLPVRIRETQTEGVLQREKDVLVITHVNSEHPLIEGQVVTTVGDDKGMVPFLPVGTVVKVLSSASDPFQRAELRIALHTRNDMPVSVLQNGELQ